MPTRMLLSRLFGFYGGRFVSQRALADELNRRGIATARAVDWHRTTVTRVLAPPWPDYKWEINNGRHTKQAAEARAKALASKFGNSGEQACLRQRHRAAS